MQVTHDQKLLIATGRSRTETNWRNRELMWSELLDKLSQPTRTRETVAEYAAFPKADRDRAKDIGGFVGGYLKNGKRNNASVVNRCLICLDADSADPGLFDDLDTLFINAYALYSTHSHTPARPPGDSAFPRGHAGRVRGDCPSHRRRSGSQAL